MSSKHLKSSENMRLGRSMEHLRHEWEDPRVRKVRLLYRRKTQERRVYMEELKELRDDRYRQIYTEIKQSIGPTWYQVLTKRHQRALDTLRQGIHQGLLEGRPTHAIKVIRALAIYPPPHAVDVFNCMDACHRDPMEFLSRLFYLMYEHDFASKRHEYDYNARMLLSSIFYLGLPGLKNILEIQFWPDREWPVTPPEPRPRPKPRHPSPYLWPQIAALYDPQPPRRKRPPPLPDLSFLDKPFDDVPPRPRPLPPPPPPPPPKKTVPLPYCYDLADYHPIHLHPKWKSYIKGSRTHIDSLTNLTKTSNLRRKRPSKMNLVAEKKVYGLGDFLPPRKKKKHKLHTPKTGIENEQYTIQGVHVHNDKLYYILGNVVILPPDGYILHGGIVMVQGKYYLWYKGIVAIPPMHNMTVCTCLDNMLDKAMGYVKKTKCYCEHRYDYKNTLDWPDDDEEEPYFKRPTYRGPFQFNYEAIFEPEPHEVHVRKEMNKLWEEDSVLIMVNADEKDSDKIAESKKKQKKKESKMYKEPPPSCLGTAPMLKDYLRCALRQVQRLNIAARLPEVYLTRELLEWMRKRIYGPFTREQRAYSVHSATTRFTYLNAFEKMGLGMAKFHPYPDCFSQTCTWARKTELQDLFEKFKLAYRIKVYKAIANFSNMFWATMDTAEFPDKNFREIYWSYMIGRVSEVVVNHPYSPTETAERFTRCLKGRYKCLPKGVLDVE